MSKKKITSDERRQLHTLPDKRFAVRAEKDDKGNRYFVGYAAVFNQRSKLIWDWDRMFYEIVLPTAFDTVLARENLDVPLVMNHIKYESFGRTISGNLELGTDEVGLWLRCLVPNTTLGNDAYEMVERGDYTDMSFRFSIEDSGSRWYKNNDGELIHEIREILDLLDVTICSLHGAYGETVIDTEVANRMYDELIREGTDPPEGGAGNTDDPPEGGTPTPTPEEEAETAKAIDLDEAEMDLEIHQAKYGVGSESET